MSEELLEALYSGLDLAVLVTVDTEYFTCLTDPPKWFERFFPDVKKYDKIAVAEASPFLQNFLVDAEEYWQRNQKGPLKSGAWIERDNQKEEWPLEASAIRINHQNLLVLSYLGQGFSDRQEQQQQVRENLLTQEKLEIEVHRRTRQIREREEEISIRLIAAAGYRDEETGTHIRRIGLYAAEMAAELNWSQTQIDDIKLAAPMHDMGKIGIADDILLKPGKLTDAEYEIMKQHARIGREMLTGSGIPMLDIAALIAGCHHEKWDGTGYPNGLKGQAIPEAARIVAIVDVYDTLTHKRVYKKPYSEPETLKIMDDMAGNHLDPNLYRIFLSMIDRIRAIKDQNQDEH